MNISASPTEPTGRIVKSCKTTRVISRIFLAFTLSVVGFSLQTAAQTAGAYQVTNLISDGSVSAAFTDPNFINPWAISDSGTWWISTANTGYNYVVGSTAPVGTIKFKVIVPPASGTGKGSPAGSVTTAGATGMILPDGTKASFLFSTLDGTISGWNSVLGTANAVSQIAINNNSAGASYPGLAILNTATASYILAANFGTANKIEVYSNTFAPTTLAGSFTDPTLPAGYSPFSVHVIDNQVYVAYAMRTATAPYGTVNALGNGAVSIFDTNGNFVARAATGGNLDSPWGVAIAPADFGIFGGALLIGNLGNGLINAYNATTYAYLGQLTDGTGAPLTYPGLWELLPGGTTVGGTTSVSGGDPSTVYFTAGLAGEAHGLFGGIANSTTATGTPTYGFSAATGALSVEGGSSVQTTVSVAPTYNFTGAVSLSCGGLPFGATCTFSPAQITATGTAPSIATLSIQTRGSTALLQSTRHSAAGIATALLLPFATALVFYRRRLPAFRGLLGLLVLCGITFVAAGVMMGCRGMAPMSTPPPGTPAGTSQVTVTASSGSISQTATIALTVQ
ncbi:MAG: TIGR03118 family protein [Terracidiphilus sp.]|jgi:uncharacterized protein (TIGR03118 family)